MFLIISEIYLFLFRTHVNINSIAKLSLYYFSTFFLFSVLYLSENKKYVYGRKEVAQGLFDGGVRKTFCGKKEMYVALMAEPTFSQFSKFMPVSKKDEVSAMRTLVKDCFIEGDHELVNNVS